MLNIFGAFGRLLPGYIQGERAAIKDNWNDLNQYNKVQAGQFQNAFDAATFNDRVSMVDHAFQNSEMGVFNNLMNMGINLARYPGDIGAADVYAQANPFIQAGMANMLLQNPMLAVPGFANQLGGSMMLPGWGQQPVQQNNLNAPTVTQWR